MFEPTNNPDIFVHKGAMSYALAELADALRYQLIHVTKRFTQATLTNTAISRSKFSGTSAATVFFRHSTSPNNSNMSFTASTSTGATMFKPFSGEKARTVDMGAMYAAVLFVFPADGDDIADVPIIYASLSYSRYFISQCYEVHSAAMQPAYADVSVDEYNELVRQYIALDTSYKAEIAALKADVYSLRRANQELSKYRDTVATFAARVQEHADELKDISRATYELVESK